MYVEWHRKINFCSKLTVAETDAKKVEDDYVHAEILPINLSCFKFERHSQQSCCFGEIFWSRIAAGMIRVLQLLYYAIATHAHKCTCTLAHRIFTGVKSLERKQNANPHWIAQTRTRDFEYWIFISSNWKFVKSPFFSVVDMYSRC